MTARDAIREFSSRTPENYKAVRDTIRDVLGDNKNMVTQTILYLAGYAFRRAFWTTFTTGATAGGVLGGPVGAMLAGGLLLGLGVVANKWGVNPVLRRYKPLIKGPEAEKYAIKALRAMMDQARRQKTLVGFRVLREMGQMVDRENEESEETPLYQRPTEPGRFRYEPPR